jgi:hypothetical protein
MNKESERARLWQLNNKERVIANLTKRKKESEDAFVESINIINERKETLQYSVLRYCRNFCGDFDYGSELKFTKTFCRCEKKECPLYPYRNGNPVRFFNGKKNNNIRK